MNDSPIHVLAYLSSSVERLPPAELETILSRSRDNNGADGITGLLLFHDGNFFQILEGPEDKVIACYERIKADPRHRGCILLYSGPYDSRRFSEWDMAYIPFAALSEDHQKGFLDLQSLRRTAKMQEVIRDDEITIFLNTFLSNLKY